jgi:hypothetical protein
MVVLAALWATIAPASATFTASAAASTSVSTHLLGVPVLSCGGVGVLSASFTWTAPADTTQPDVYGSGNLATGYEVLRGTTSGGPYPVVVAQSGTSYTDSLSAGTFFYVVRTTKQGWKGAYSNERKVVAVALVLASCS